MTQILESFKQQAVQAHNWTSFSPERRGESLVKEHGEELEGDIEELKGQGADDAAIASYVSRYKKFFGSWLGAKGRCLSSMITGPARFPVRRAEKANRSEHRHWEVFREWRGKAKKAIVRAMQPEKTYLTEIERLKADLESRKVFQETAKAANKIIRKKISDEAKIEALKEIGIPTPEKLLIPDFCGRVGFASYLTTNNLANIKRIEGRIADLERKEEANQATGGEKEIPFEGGVVVLNYAINRVQIKFPGKPAPEKIKELKGQGFRWAPSEMAWQRFISPASSYAVARVTGLQASEIK